MITAKLNTRSEVQIPQKHSYGPVKTENEREDRFLDFKVKSAYFWYSVEHHTQICDADFVICQATRIQQVHERVGGITFLT